MFSRANNRYRKTSTGCLKGGCKGGGSLQLPMPSKREPFRKPLELDARLHELLDALVDLLFRRFGEQTMARQDSEPDDELGVWAGRYVRSGAMREILARKLEAPARVLCERSMLEYLRKQRVVTIDAKTFGGPANPELVTLLRVLHSDQNGFAVRAETADYAAEVLFGAKEVPHA